MKRRTALSLLALDVLFYALLVSILGINRLTILLLVIGACSIIFGAGLYLSEETKFFQTVFHRFLRSLHRLET